MLIPVLIKLSVTFDPFDSDFFLLLAIYSENVVHKCCIIELCKNQKKTFVMEAFLKSWRL